MVNASGRRVVVVVVAAIALQVDASQKLSCSHQQANNRAAPCALKMDPIKDVRDIGGRDVYRIRMTNVGNHIEKSRERMILELGRDDIRKKPSILVTSKEIIVLFLFRF